MTPINGFGVFPASVHQCPNSFPRNDTFHCDSVSLKRLVLWSIWMCMSFKVISSFSKAFHSRKSIDIQLRSNNSSIHVEMLWRWFDGSLGRKLCENNVSFRTTSMRFHEQQKIIGVFGYLSILIKCATFKNRPKIIRRFIWHWNNPV